MKDHPNLCGVCCVTLEDDLVGCCSYAICKGCIAKLKRIGCPGCRGTERLKEFIEKHGISVDGPFRHAFGSHSARALPVHSQIDRDRCADCSIGLSVLCLYYARNLCPICAHSVANLCGFPLDSVSTPVAIPFRRFRRAPPSGQSAPR